MHDHFLQGAFQILEDLYETCFPRISKGEVCDQHPNLPETRGCDLQASHKPILDELTSSAFITCTRVMIHQLLTLKAFVQQSNKGMVQVVVLHDAFPSITCKNVGGKSPCPKPFELEGNPTNNVSKSQ